MAGVTYRGFHPRTSAARWGLAAVAVGVIVGGTLPVALVRLAGVVADNPGGLPWLFERLFAWLAYGAMAGSVVYGLLLSTRLLDAIAHRPVSFFLHQDLAAIGIGLAGIHGFLLGLDHTVPFSVSQILVPGTAPHAPLAVGLGQVGLYLALIVTASYYARRIVGVRAWRVVHYATFGIFVLVTAHGIASGTDSGAAWAEAIYLGATALVTFLLAYRILLSGTARRAQPAEVSRAAR